MPEGKIKDLAVEKQRGESGGLEMRSGRLSECKSYRAGRKYRVRIDKHCEIMDNRFQDCASRQPCCMKEYAGVKRRG